MVSPQDLSLTPAQERELERRVAAYREDGDPGQPWEDALREIETSASADTEVRGPPLARVVRLSHDRLVHMSSR